MAFPYPNARPDGKIMPLPYTVSVLFPHCSGWLKMFSGVMRHQLAFCCENVYNKLHALAWGSAAPREQWSQWWCC